MVMFLSWAEFGGPETCRESLLVDTYEGREREEGRGGEGRGGEGEKESTMLVKL